MTIVLFCFKFFIYNCSVGDSRSLDRSAVPSSSSYEKVVNVSFPMRDKNGLTVNGFLSAWLRWCAFLSVITWSISVGTSIFLNSKFFVDLMSFHFTDVSFGISIVFRFVFLELLVRYLILSTLLLLVLFFGC